MCEQIVTLDRWVKQSAIVSVTYGRNKVRKGKITKRSKAYTVNGLHFVAEEISTAAKDVDGYKRITLIW